MTETSRKRYYFINLAAQATGRMISIAVNLAIFMLVARVMGTEKFGQFSYIIAFLGIAMTIAEFGTTSILAKDMAQIGEETPTYWGNFILLRLTLGLVVAFLGILAAYHLRSELFPFLLAGLAMLPFIASRFFDPVFQVHRTPWFSTASSVTYASVYLILTWFSLQMERPLGWLVVSYGLSNALYMALAFALSYSLVKPDFRFRPEMIRKNLVLAWPVGIASLITMINTRADIFMLAAMKSDYEVGIYSAAYRFLDLAATLAIILMNPILPIFSKDAESDRRTLHDTFALTIESVAMMTLPVAVITPYVSIQVISVFFGEAFQASAQVLNILSYVGVLVFVSIFSMALCVAIGVVHFGWWNAALAAVVNVILNYYLIPRYSYIGSAYATVFCEIMLLGVTFCYITLHIGNVFKPARWFKIMLAGGLLMFILHFFPYRYYFTHAVVGLTAYISILFMLNLIPRQPLFKVLKHMRKKAGVNA